MLRALPEHRRPDSGTCRLPYPHCLLMTWVRGVDALWKQPGLLPQSCHAVPADAGPAGPTRRMRSTVSPHLVDYIDSGGVLTFVRTSHEGHTGDADCPRCVLLPARSEGDAVEPSERWPAAPGRPEVEIHRSPRRRRSASAAFTSGRIVVRVPAGLPRQEETSMVEKLVAKVAARHRAEATGGDEALQRRADQLADRYLDGVRATSVRWSARMNTLHGSCTPANGTIRISTALARHPQWVRDYVLIHELAHLTESGHGRRFEALVARYPQAERARGYLDGFTAAEFEAAAGRSDYSASPSAAGPSSEPLSSESL